MKHYIKCINVFKGSYRDFTHDFGRLWLKFSEGERFTFDYTVSSSSKVDFKIPILPCLRLYERTTE